MKLPRIDVFEKCESTTFVDHSKFILFISNVYLIRIVALFVMLHI